MFAQLAQLSNSMGPDFLLVSLVWLVATAFWLWMLVDCLTKKRLPDNEKLIWVLVLLLTNVIGAVLYLAIVRRRAPRS